MKKKFNEKKVLPHMYSIRMRTSFLYYCLFDTFRHNFFFCNKYMYATTAYIYQYKNSKWRFVLIVYVQWLFNYSENVHDVSFLCFILLYISMRLHSLPLRKNSEEDLRFFRCCFCFGWCLKVNGRIFSLT